jgi:mRNA interferase YafQ
MRTIERSTAFKRDYKRETKGQHRKTLNGDLAHVLTLLADDKPLEARYRDHDLSGN